MIEVCNPYKAKEALEKDITVGYYLPCKISVYEKDDAVYVGFIDPEIMLQGIENQGLKEIAVEVIQKITDIINSLI